MPDWQPKALPVDSNKVGLPPRPFLYTLDQIGALLSLEELAVRKRIHFEGRSVGKCPRDKMVARNIAAPNTRPDWRVAERELVRWLKVMGFRYYDRGWVTH